MAMLNNQRVYEVYWSVHFGVELVDFGLCDFFGPLKIEIVS